MSTHEAWSLVCRLFAGGTPVFRAALSPAEIGACATLGPAIKPTVINRTFTLCPYCQQRSGQIFGDGQGGQICQCPDCGPIPLAADDRAAVRLDETWLMLKMRIALEIESRDGVTDLGDGVWRLGEARREPVLLSRSLSRLWADPSLFDRVRVAGAGIRVIAPRAAQMRGAPFASAVEWLPLEERFTFYGGGIAYIPSGVSPEAVAADDPWTPVNGPFSADFRWVTIDGWSHGPIRCTDGQAAVFSAIWSFKGTEVDGERIMKRAGQESDKPIDLFKVKAANKGKPEYEGPLYAYRALVKSKRREGVYWMPCAAPGLGVSLMVCLSKQVVELEKSTHAQLVVAQGDVRVLRRKSWQRFRENRGQKRVELAAIGTVSDHPLAHAECAGTPRVMRETQMKTPN